MSLLSAVLQEANKATTEDFKKLRDNILPKVRDLTERTEMLSFALQQHFLDNYLHFTTTKSLEQLNYVNRKASILSDYKSVNTDVQDLLMKSYIQDEELLCHINKLKSTFTFFENMSIVVEGKRILERARHARERYHYAEAIMAVKELKNQLNEIKFQGNVAKALNKLKAQTDTHLSMYKADLAVEWEENFSFSEEKCIYYCTYSIFVQQSDLTIIEKVLQGLYITESLHAELAPFSDFFLNKLLDNLIKHSCDIFTEDSIGALVFSIKIDLKDKTKPNFETVFNNLTVVFAFLQSTLGSQLNNFIEVFAETIREKFFYKIFEDCIRNNLPSCDSSYETYKNLVAELDAFNTFLIDLKFVKAEDSPLKKYIDDTESVLYRKKCDKLLTDVRHLLSESLSSGTITVGSTVSEPDDSTYDFPEREITWDINKPVFLPMCVISQNVKQIMTMVLEHLGEALKLPEKYSRQIVKYVKDIAVMYQTVIPVKFKANLEHCPLDIALFFNNCFFLAHSLFGPPWKLTLHEPLAKYLTTVLFECIHDLRVIGLEKISVYLQNQINEMTKKIEENAKQPWTQDTFEQFEVSVNFALSTMRDLKSAWHNILPTRMYSVCVCTLVQAFCTCVLSRVFNATGPFIEHNLLMLRTTLEDAVDLLRTMFEEPIVFEEKIPIWNKFIKLPSLLNAQLLEVSNMWNRDKTISESYTCEEVRQIVKMRFPDNSYRLEILKEIQ